MFKYYKLYEADAVAADDEEDRPSRPTRQQDQPDLDAFRRAGFRSSSSDNLPAGRPQGRDQGGGVGNDRPNMPRASGSDTRSRTSRITPTDQMRDMINRINFTPADDEIDDRTAAQRAGLDQNPENLPDVRRVTADQVPAILNRSLRAAGEQMPEWHTINNLPGYMARAIRSMGRQFFGMFTSTPLEQIMTIANVQDQGPNSAAEMRAVAAWLRDNAEDHGPVEVDMGQAIPGYRPEVREYSAQGIRFHVVRDPMGQYIYAYPDQDARSHIMTDRIGNDNDSNNDDERDEMGARIKKLRESKMINQVDLLRRLSNIVESAEINVLASPDFDQIVFEAKQTLLAEASTLSRLIGDSPGGQNMVQWLHKSYGLSNTADWNEIGRGAERVQWKMFKEYPDQFIVVSGKTAVVAIKPLPKKGDRDDNTKQTAGDTTIEYEIVGFQRDQRIDNLFWVIPPSYQEMDTQERAKYDAMKDSKKAEYDRERQEAIDGRAATTQRGAPPTKFRITRGGLPFKKDSTANFFDRVKEVLGGINAIYVSTGRQDVRGGGIRSTMDKRAEKAYVMGKGSMVEPRSAFTVPDTPKGELVDPSRRATAGAVPRDLQKARAEKYVEPAPGDVSAVVKKLQPIILPMINKLVDKINQRVRQFANGGNYDQVANLSRAAQKLQAMQTALDSDTPDVSGSYGTPMYTFVKVVRDAIDKETNNMDSSEKQEYVSNLTQDNVALASILDHVRHNLLNLR